MYDCKITGGLVVDGTGAVPRLADLGIVDDRIVAVGEAPGDAATVIDAGGCAVAPGFVDLHTHYDAQVIWDRMLTVSPWHGVTTVVMGNCGFGVAPTRPADREHIVATLEKVEGMSAAALLAGLGRDWPFETFPEYLDAVERLGTAVNTAVMIGHTPLRLSVLGPAATDRPATADEVATMAAAVRDAVEAGAVGFATSKSDTHVGAGGRPVPSRLADLDEILALAGAVREGGGGIVQATMGRGLAFAELARVAEVSGGPVTWTALLANVGDGVSQLLLEENHRLLDAGIPVYPQVSCRPLRFEFTLDEPFPFEGLALFAPVSSASGSAPRRAVYEDPAFRTAWSEAMAAGRAGSLAVSWARTEISWFPPEPGLEGRLVADVAAERGVDPTGLVIDLALASDLAARFRAAIYNYDDDEVEGLLTDPRTVLGLSDAGAHASQLCDACFTTHLLGHWVRERRSLTLEAAVAKLTAEPARLVGLVDRGVLDVGKAADVVVFDPATVGAGPLRRVADQPAGAERLVADALGVRAVLVNGTVLRRDGEDAVDPAGALPGRLLRNGGG